MTPLLMAMMAAGQDPERWGPLLDSLGPSFSPDRLVPALSRLGGPTDNPFATSGAPSAFTPPPGAGAGVGGLPAGTPSAPPTVEGLDPLFTSLMFGSGPMGGGVTPGAVPMPGAPAAGAPPAGANPLMQLAQASGQVGPQSVRPQADKPVYNAGVSGAQKAPEMGVQAPPGGSPAQMLMQLLLGGGRGQANPLRVPTLGALLGGAT